MNDCICDIVDKCVTLSSTEIFTTKETIANTVKAPNGEILFEYQCSYVLWAEIPYVDKHMWCMVICKETYWCNNGSFDRFIILNFLQVYGHLCQHFKIEAVHWFSIEFYSGNTWNTSLNKFVGVILHPKLYYNSCVHDVTMRATRGQILKFVKFVCDGGAYIALSPLRGVFTSG